MKKFSWMLPYCFMIANPVMAFPHASLVPGGIALIPLGQVNSPAPTAQYDGQRIAVVPTEQEWLGVVGIPLQTKPGTHKLTVSNQSPITFDVADKNYRTQRLTIRDKNKVDPDEESGQRIVRELAIQKRLKVQYSPTLPQLNFIRPVPGTDTGRFGLRRILNGQARSPHSGMDIAAGTGTPVKTCAAGRVVYTDNFFFSGNVVYVDHGSGVISLYAHLSEMTVKPGDELQQGDIVGKVGSTGRATGPHLHWTVYLNGTAVDPALFL